MPHRLALSAGDKVKISNDEYTINRLISRGGTSLIYEASRPYNTVDYNLNIETSNVKKVIIKEMAPYDIKFTREAGWITFHSKRIKAMEDIFQNEIQNIAMIQRQNTRLNRIPDMDAFGQCNGTMYIAMNHIKGELLSSYIRENDLDFNTIIHIFKNILMIIEELHNMKESYLHLDLKPMNFIVGGLGTVYLFDFGSSMVVDGVVVKNYTENYCAPEVLFNYYSKVGKVSDIYSLGVILYEMITKDVPELDELLLNNGKFYIPKQDNPDLNSLIAMMLDQNEKKRPQNVREVFQVLDLMMK